MNAKVGLEEMRFKAYHGYYAEEGRVGGEYLLSVWIDYYTNKKTAEDDLDEVIDYEELYEICAAVMAEPKKLIETVTQELREKILEKWSSIEALKIILKKLNPPLTGPTNAATFELNYRS